MNKTSKSIFTGILIACFLLVSNAFGQVSDTVLQAMVGRNVTFSISGGGIEVDFTGNLLKVEKNKVIIISAKDGKVQEVLKSSILSIKEAGNYSNKKSNLKGKSKINPWGAGAIGWFVGFGIGSYVQGDIKGGTAGLIWDLVNLGIIIGAAVTVPTVSLRSSTINGFTTSSVSSSDSTAYIVLAVLSGLSTTASRIYQAVRPHSWHKKNLAFLEESSIYVIPDVTSNGDIGGIKVGMIFNTKL